MARSGLLTRFCASGPPSRGSTRPIVPLGKIRKDSRRESPARIGKLHRSRKRHFYHGLLILLR